MSLSRPRQGKHAKHHEQATQHDAFIEDGRDCHLAAIQQHDVRQLSLNTPQHWSPIMQLPMGFLAGSSTPDNVCNVPYRRAIEQNGITSNATRTPDDRHATIDPHNTPATRQPRLQSSQRTVLVQADVQSLEPLPRLVPPSHGISKSRCAARQAVKTHRWSVSAANYLTICWHLEP
jgi:hypothetical protein